MFVPPPLAGTVLRTYKTPGTKDASQVKHYCLDHYPFQVCANPNCGKKLRPHNSTKADWPGTVAKGSADMCTTCYRHMTMYGTMRKPARRWQSAGLPGNGYR